MCGCRGGRSYRFHPTPQQADLLHRTFGCVRYVYNWALALRTEAYVQRGERLCYAATDRALTALKADPEHAWLREVSSVPLQQALRHLQDAFAAFWDKRAGYPRFKSKKRGKASATFTRSAFRWRDGQLWLAKCSEPLAIVWSRPLLAGAEPSTVTVTRDRAGRWFVSILVGDPTIRPLPEVAGEVGVDAGLTSLVTLSTGEKITNPRHERRDRARLARKEKGSKNREKARLKVARIADRRRDLLHQLSTRLVRENQTVVLEDLSVRNMVKNRRLARAISDAAWAELRAMLEYKCRWYGRRLVVVDRWLPSSKMCSACGHVLDSLPLHVRAWACPACRATHDRDVNAARNSWPPDGR
ncbi:Transposase [Carbonactinospora thermoautotrophica]|uniref:Transposase n=1 Tax=Carbonactinospora thermoautotrophica TaxID=1469144 RepID=A0A132MS86_9ACTN|nr:Transposase [Carbonactinospora thermoautotrophica]